MTNLDEQQPLNQQSEITSAALSRKPQIFILWFLGMLGVISLLPVISQLLAERQQDLPFSIEIVQAISVLQSALLVFIAALIGAYFSHRVKLSSPAIQAVIQKQPVLPIIKSQLGPAVLGGIAGGIFILLFSGGFTAFLPQEFLSAAEKLTLPWYAKIFYGGITEEILMRWGLMSFLVWGSWRLLGKDSDTVHTSHYIVGILIAAILFGIGHLPTVYAISPVVNSLLITYIIAANASFGLIAGFLYWRYGLECAIMAHMVVHITMLIAGGIFT